MKYYPAFINLENRKCVVVGGGAVAERKTVKLLAAGARVTVISPDITPLLAALRDSGKLLHHGRPFTQGDLDGAFLVIAATSDPALNRLVAESSTCLVNVADMPQLCNFIVPSTLERGHLRIAISTSGASPSAARTIRLEMEKLYTSDTGRYLKFLKGLREKTLASVIDRRRRETFLKEAGSGAAFKTLREKGFESIRDELNARFKSLSILPSGAKPGKPGVNPGVNPGVKSVAKKIYKIKGDV
jgi:precorrin-2 dehydrogenase/sirohydrochlorin ferrochelatase